MTGGGRGWGLKDVAIDRYGWGQSRLKHWPSASFGIYHYSGIVIFTMFVVAQILLQDQIYSINALLLWTTVTFRALISPHSFLGNCT